MTTTGGSGTPPEPPLPPPIPGESESELLPPPPGWGGSESLDMEVVRKGIWELGPTRRGQDEVRRRFFELLDGWTNRKAHESLIYTAQKQDQLQYLARLYGVVLALDPNDFQANQSKRQIAATSMFSAGVGTGTQRGALTTRAPGLLGVAAAICMTGALFSSGGTRVLLIILCLGLLAGVYIIYRHQRGAT